MPKPKLITVPDDVREVLRASSISPSTLVLPGQLDRPLYEKTAKVIKAAGGKWDARLRLHTFTTDPRTALGLAVEQGTVVNRQQTLQAFYTPPALADRLAREADIKPGMKVLEPSAGTGNLLRAVIKIAERPSITCIEIDPDSAEVLAVNFPAVELINRDFLAACPRAVPLFDRVVMNPPFTAGQDIAHVLHAWKFLKPGGRLVAIVSPRAIVGQNKAEREFRRFVSDNGEWHKLPPESFKESGTSVDTYLIVVDKPAAKTVPTPPDMRLVSPNVKRPGKSWEQVRRPAPKKTTNG